MLRTTLLSAFAATLATLGLSSPVEAWGGYHAGYTAVTPGGTYHAQTTAVGGYGGAAHGGVAYGSTAHGGVAYGGAYHGGAAYGGAAVGGYHYSPSYSGMYGTTGHPGGTVYQR